MLLEQIAMLAYRTKAFKKQKEHAAQTHDSLCVCSEGCTDGQTAASQERAKALLGMAILPPLIRALEILKLLLSLLEVNFMKKITKNLLGKRKKTCAFRLQYE